MAGRPKREGPRRTVRVQVMVTPEELEQFATMAELAGYSLSSWFRVLGLKESKEVEK